jgi:hypothetical protein
MLLEINAFKIIDYPGVTNLTHITHFSHRTSSKRQGPGIRPVVPTAQLVVQGHASHFLTHTRSTLITLFSQESHAISLSHRSGRMVLTKTPALFHDDSHLLFFDPRWSDGV